MNIYYDSELSKKLEGMFRAKFQEAEEERMEVHLSDLCKCPIKCFNRLTGHKSEFDSKSIGMMLIGMVGQEMFQSLFPEEQREYEPDAELPEGMRIPAHIDIFMDMEFPSEIKWSRRKIFRGSDVSPSWILQLSGYLARTHKLIGYMIILNVISATIHCFKMIMTEEDIVRRNAELIEGKAQIVLAVSRGDASTLEPWPKDCKYCDYRPTRKKKKAGEWFCPHYIVPKRKKT